MQIKKNLVFAALAVLTVIGLAVGLFIWPNYRQVISIRSETAALEKRIAGLKSQSEILERLEADLTHASQHIETELKYIPPSPDLASVIRRLSQDLDRVTVLDQTFTAGSPCEAVVGAQTTMQAMPLTVDMDARFDAVFALIRHAESMDRLVRIATVRISCKRDEANAEPPIVDASIGLEAIFDSPPQGDSQAAARDRGLAPLSARAIGSQTHRPIGVSEGS